MRFTHIVLDMDMTVFDYPTAQLHAFRGCVKSVGIEYTREVHELYSECNERQWRLFEQKRVTIDELQVNRFRDFLEQLGRDGSDAAKLNGTYIGLLAKGGYLIPNAGRTVERLAERCILAVATNGIATVQRGRLNESGLADCFKYVFISEEIGLVKPDVGFFNYMLEKMEANDPKEVLMVGDSLHADIAGAAEAGISTCWANYGSAENRTDIAPDYEISSPDKLLEIVD